jgi:hypothetical protein
MSRHETDPDMDWASAYRFLEEELRSALLAVADRMETLESDLEAARRTAIRAVSLTRLDSGHLRSVVAADGADLRFAFYIYRDDVLVREQDYSESNTLVWTPDRSGRYRVRGFIRRGAESGAADTRVSATLTVSVE